MQLSRAKPGNPASIYMESVYVHILPSVYGLHVAACGSIETKFGTYINIHLERVVGHIKITPCDLGGIWGVLRGQTCGKITKLLDGWHTCSNLSGNGHQLIICSHMTPKGVLLGVSGGHQFRNLGRVLNDWTDWYPVPNLAHVCRFIWEWTFVFIKSKHLRSIGGIFGVSWGQKFESVKGGQMSGHIGTTFGIHMEVGLGVDLAKTNLPHEAPEGAMWGGY